MNNYKHDRERLPIVAPGTEDDPEAWDYLDAVHLLALGQLPEHLRTTTHGVEHVDSDNMAAISAYLTATRQHGVYEDHVRATGVVIECPNWCESEAHPRAALYDVTGPETALVCHSKLLLELAHMFHPLELQLKFERWQGGEEDGRSSLYLSAEGELNAEQARILANVLLDVADELDADDESS